MKIDELIKELEKVREEHGNLKVFMDDDGRPRKPEKEIMEVKDKTDWATKKVNKSFYLRNQSEKVDKIFYI